MPIIIRNTVLILLLLVSTTKIFAGTESRYPFWLGVDTENNLKPNSKWHYDFFVQSRFTTNQVMLEQALIRPAIFYQYNDNWSYWLGYDFNPTIPGGGSNVDLEQSLWPQI